MNSQPAPWVPSDLEAYCFLKKRLPAAFSIQAEPSTAYFSEWQFRYRIYRRGELFAELAGDYREIAPGSLAAKAVALLERASGE
jgi:hypothetical protein